MILADKIIEERKRCGMSQEELAEKLSVSRQAVSKWESAQTMPDLNKIIRLAELFGVTTDYLVRDDCEPANRPQTTESETDSALRRVSLEEANAYMTHCAEAAKKIALGVAMCIISPALLILLAGFAEDPAYGIGERAAVAFGIVALFALIAGAVFIFVSCSAKGERFKYLERENFETAYGVSGVVRERAAAYRETYVRGLSLGITLCVIAAVPLIVWGVLGAKDSLLTALVALLLVFVAAGVYLIVSVSTVKSGFDMLLEEGEYTRRNKRSNGRTEAIGGIYWSVVTAGYLAWSFITNDWHRTWIVWPVAGIAFGIISSVIRITAKDGER